MTQPAAPVADQPTVIFIHIGKTGGATLRRIMARNVRDDAILRLRNPAETETGFLSTAPIEQFAALDAERRAAPRLIMAHMVYGLHAAVPRPSTYVTLLRKPMARVISGYKSARYWPGHRLHDIVNERQMDLAEYVQSGVALEMDNSMTRAIVGDVTTPYGQCTDEMLAHAKQLIAQQYAVVGLTERFDETLVVLGQTFGWSRLCYVRANVSRKQISPDFPKATIALIEELNRFDLELYEFADRRLTDAENMDRERFEREMSGFRRRNRAYRPWGTLTYSVPQRFRRRITTGKP
jgi:hypothetical protein